MKIPQLMGISLLTAVGSVAITEYVVAAPNENPALPETPKVEWKEPELASKEKLGDKAYRLDERPGNYAVLAVVEDFLEGMHSLRPELRNASFPFQMDSGLMKGMDEWEADLQGSEKEGQGSKGKPRNKLRQYNIVVKRLDLVKVEKDQKIAPSDAKFSENEKKKFETLRQHHSERGYVVNLYAGLESLQSAKVEGDDGNDDPDIIMMVVFKTDGWKVIWFDK